METRSGFDFNATLAWVTGVLKDPNGTAAAYRETQPPWQRTFMQITLPVYVASAVIGFVLSLIFGQSFLFGATAAAPMLFLMSLAWSVAYVFVAAFIFDYFAGVFEGERHYDSAFATISLAMIPAVVIGILSPLPWLGWLISLVAVIYSLVLLYRFIGVFMTVPESKRVVHYVVSLVVAIVTNFIVAVTIGAIFGPDIDDYLDSSGVTGGDRSSGLFSDFERQADYAEQAANDRYDPPSDGRLTEAQVAAYVRTLERTAELRERLGGNLENMEERDPSIGDIFSGVNDAVRMGTAEMEVVKTAGGNWKEHVWVKDQIEIARVQRDSTPAVVHNYELFLEYRDQIEEFD